MNVELAGNRLQLRPDRTAWWPRRRMLLVADLHLGKDQVFRSAGVAIPGGVLDAELRALADAVDASGAERLVVLGDLVHAAPGEERAWTRRLGEWRRARSELGIGVVLGNHDRGLAPWLAEWRMENLGAVLELDGLRLCHDVDLDRPPPGLSGHVHPAVRLQAAGDALRVPAFARRGDHVILPSFGRFTGGFQGLDPREWQMLAVAGRGVRAVPGSGTSASNRDPDQDAGG
ncbi:MAG: ligase-associated DNA damage response endonuclease PdeM [Wenzhouxiangellaceae bacterium]|nr:ligase-associated DNA damage response endonuclease PdeM [Wenzhouxiangellaceae bacterium]